MAKRVNSRARTNPVPHPAQKKPAELRHMLTQVDDFLATLSHELRQPLSAALAAIEIQKHSPTPERQEKARRVIEQQVRHIARLVGDLSEVSRISRGRIELRRERIEIRAVIRDAMAMTEAIFDQRRHRVSAALGTCDVWVHGDAVRLKQVFSNLLRNAAAYTPPGGLIQLQLDVPDDRVRCRIKDNGDGISADSLQRIFDLFERGDRRVDGQSAGIGLAVVRQIVELHGGSVTATSDGRGRGSEFTVLLPRHAS